MGFWNGIVRVAQGKPVFIEEGGAKEGGQPSRQQEADAPQIHQNGQKNIPEVLIEHCKSNSNGSEIEVTVWMTNQSSVEIELDKIIMLGKTIELDRILMPNEAREIRLYKGEAPKSDDDEMARLQYKQRENGDYFQADFTIEFNYTPQGLYEIEELHPIHPIRDV